MNMNNVIKYLEQNAMQGGYKVVNNDGDISIEFETGHTIYNDITHFTLFNQATKSTKEFKTTSNLYKELRQGLI